MTNVVVLMGNVVQDAESKTFEKGSVIKFRLAVNNGNDKRHPTTFVDVEKWGDSGPKLAPYLVKGKKIAVTGELLQDSWEQDGVKRSKLFVKARDLHFASSGEVRNETAPETTTNEEVKEDDVPF